MRAAQAAETRRRLTDVAIGMFSATHYDEVAVADIAKAAGVAHGLLFHHFGNKRGIYLAAMHEAATQLNAAFIVDPTLTPDAQLRQAFAAHLRYLSANRGLALRLVLGGRGADPEAWEVFERARMDALYGVASVLGLDRANPALLMTGRAAIAAIDSATAYWLENGEPFPVETMVESLMSMAVFALDGAKALDPALDVADAIGTLRGTVATSGS
ncbi:TetR/AcrR family transcriptional regulator [Nocardia sp. NPDC003693]